MCTIVETRGGTDTHSFFTHAVAQTYWHICINAICQYLRIQYANICTCNMQIFANAICKYLQMQYNAYYTFDRHAVEVNRSYLLPLSQSSPAQGICKTAFLKHPGSFWLQKNRARSLINWSFSQFFKTFFGVPWNVCNCCVFWPHISHLTYMIVGSWVNLGKRHQIW